jgi:hypothetical protein
MSEKFQNSLNPYRVNALMESLACDGKDQTKTERLPECNDNAERNFT